MHKNGARIATSDGIPTLLYLADDLNTKMGSRNNGSLYKPNNLHCIGPLY
jgi:hypothetical protein